ncbi:MAG: tetraacyldisaccharide 4'-kinase [Pirellulales bacterium]
MSGASWHRQWVRTARGPGGHLLRGLLWLASLVYAVAMRWRNAAFRRGRRAIHRLTIPVVSVGNLTVGGTGKTPLVAWLAQWLANRGVRVVIVSRGYGARPGQPNDEARELADRLPQVPHLQQADRVAAGQRAIQRYDAQCLVLDDAFQHRRLHRDLDIVLLDALDPFGGDYLLPRGLLREPLSSLARAAVLVLTRADLVDEATRLAIRDRALAHAPHAVWLEAGLAPGELLRHEHPPAHVRLLAGRPVAAFCGIGNPTGFRRTLQACGLQVVHWREFPDHHDYPQADQDELTRWAASLSDVSAIVCTHKDWVKLSQSSLGPHPLYALTVSLDWRTDPAPLLARLSAWIPESPLPAEPDQPLGPQA